ncbi:MAG TPA: protein kinase [Polyangiaceae bacterium]|nr:protein kinase [Polyangiaceae bacterium]
MPLDRAASADGGETPSALSMSAATFGRFRLLARLGKGGMGDVFLAAAKGIDVFDKLLVIKRLRETYAEDEHMRALFLAEGKLAARLNHPNVVQTYEVGQEGKLLYLAMEYLEGQSLSLLNRTLGSQSIATPIAARVMSEALAGLHHAHELTDYDGTPLGLVHRDVSPHNIFLTYDGVTKVLDFGIAKVKNRIGQTEEGVLKGKLSYMAPEHAAGAETDQRSDVFAVGIVLWELIARTRLMDDSSLVNTLYKLMNEEVPRVSTIVPGVDPMLDDIIQRALQRNPKHRYQTAQEMRDALEEFIAQSGHFVRAEDIAGLLEKHFGHRRERMREAVKGFMAPLSDPGSTQPSAPKSVPPASMRTLESSVLSVAQKTPVESVVLSRRKTSSRMLLAVAGLALVGGTWFALKKLPSFSLSTPSTAVSPVDTNAPTDESSQPKASALSEPEKTASAPESSASAAASTPQRRVTAPRPRARTTTEKTPTAEPTPSPAPPSEPTQPVPRKRKIRTEF